jgi:hypothetical protein
MNGNQMRDELFPVHLVDTSSIEPIPFFKMGGGGKIPYVLFGCLFISTMSVGKIKSDRDRCSYPKEVWSPAGGWYAQPANWRANTAIMTATIVGIVAVTWSISAEREYRDRMPQPGRFFPSR